MPKIGNKSVKENSILDKYPNIKNYIDFHKEGYESTFQATKSLSFLPADSRRKFHFKCPTCRKPWKTAVDSAHFAFDSNGEIYHKGCNEKLRHVKYSHVYPNIRKLIKSYTLIDSLYLESNVTIPRKMYCQNCQFDFELSLDKLLSRLFLKGYGCEKCKITFKEPLNRSSYNEAPINFIKPGLLDEWSDKNEIGVHQVDILSDISVLWDCSICNGTYSCKIREKEVTDCPFCSMKEMQKGVNTLQIQHEKLEIFWSPNNQGTLDDYWVKSKEALTWICPCCEVEFECIASEMVARVNIDNKNFQTCPNLCNWTDEVFDGNALYDYPILIREWGKDNEIEIKHASISSQIKQYWWDCSQCKGTYSTSIPNRISNSDCCPYCNWLEPLPGFNTVEDVYPELKKFWSYNNTVNLNQFVPKEDNNRAYIWRCRKCTNTFTEQLKNVINEYESISRIGIRAICPYCTKELPDPELNSLDKIKPFLVEEWIPEKNGDIKKFYPESTEMVWWKCRKCNGKYLDCINKREEDDTVCPYCSKKQLLEGFNDLATTHPDLLKEWDYLNNLLLLDPKKTIGNTRKKAWWICQTNPEHRYIMCVYDRIIYSKREKEPCIYCKGLRRKKEHFVQFKEKSE